MAANQQYHRISKIFHWAMALLIIGQIAGGVFMVYFISSESSFNISDFYSLHKSFGVLLIILVAFRVINRLINKPPAIPTTINKSERFLAHGGHYCMYALMFLIPLSGYLMSNSFGYSVKLFSIELPNLIARDYYYAPLYKSAHFYFGYTLLTIIILHIAATIRHRYFDRKENDILKRMT